jgi:hypothetical protein
MFTSRCTTSKSVCAGPTLTSHRQATIGDAICVFRVVYFSSHHSSEAVFTDDNQRPLVP